MVFRGVLYQDYRIDAFSDKGVAQTVALVVPGKGRYQFFPTIRLSGFPVGPHVQAPVSPDGSGLYLAMSWSDKERNRILSAGQPLPVGLAYTDTEKRWMKTHYGGEFKFLQAFGLNIYKEEHRHEGRGILRGFMTQDNEVGETPSPSVKGAPNGAHTATVGTPGNSSSRSRDIPSDDYFTVMSGLIALSRLSLPPSAPSHDQPQAPMQRHGITPIRKDDPTTTVGKDVGNANPERPARKPKKKRKKYKADDLFSETQLDWIKDNYATPAAFMKAHNLNFKNKNDRDTAKVLVEQFQYHDEGDGDELYPKGLDDDDGDCDNTSDPEGHMTDYLFSDEQLDWIKTHYGNSMTFMFSYGLKFYDEEDCDEAVAIVDAMMNDDSSEEEDNTETKVDDDVNKDSDNVSGPGKHAKPYIHPASQWNYA